MAWKPSFNQGITSFKELCLDEALNHFSKASQTSSSRRQVSTDFQALKCTGGDQQHVIYDSRAAVHEKLGMHKEALRDARAVIKLAPDQWQGYARAARLFLLASKFDASLSMADMALSRIKQSNTKRREEISRLKDDILRAQCAEAKLQRSMRNQFEKLPVELLGEVFRYALSDDPGTLIRVLRVCSYWRNVAWTTPALWDTLILTARFPVRKLSLWLNQSKGIIRELYVRADVTNHPEWPFSELANIAWDRVRVFSAVSWDVAQYIENRKLGKDSLSCLEAFEMMEERFCRRRASPGLFSLLRNATLRSICFAKSEFSWKEISDNLASLTSLSIHSGSKDPQYLMQALEANPGLETVKILDHFNYICPGRSPLRLSYLTHLELMGSWAPSLLESLVVPNLYTLIIRASSFTLDLAFNRMIATEGSIRLTHLIIDRCSIDSNVINQLLQRAENLTHLQLNSLSKCANSVIENLAGSVFPKKDKTAPLDTIGTPIICPALTHIDVSQSQDVLTGPLIRLVKSRISAAAAITAWEESHAVNVDNEGTAPPPKCARIVSLIMDQCSQIDAAWLPWLRKNLQNVSCVYEPKQKSHWR
ncbi:hypothetical protein C0993_006497 [Termitomyces sp. T159_Od127]|nr:hypothetical protein C0993_006497 [Termitomyces sp. T159_Od127]